MKKHLLLFAFVLLSVILKSQATLPAVSTAVPEWITYNGTQYFFYKNVTKTDRAGSVFVAGATFNTAGNSDILIAKYSSTGQMQWIHQFAGLAGMHDFAAGLAVTNSAAYLTGVVFNNTVTAESDVITIKFNTTTGAVQWTSTYNGAANSLDGGKNIVASGSDLYVTGGSYNASYNCDFLTIKYDEATGAQTWASTYDYVGADDAAIKSVVSGGNLTVTGAVTTTTANVYKYATLTYALSSGSLTATNISTVVTTTSVNAVTDITSDAAGNIYIVGSTTAVGQGENMYVQKLSGTLASVWTYTYNGASNLDDIAKGIQVDNSSNVFITGYSTSSTQGRNICLIKLNSSGANQFTVFGNDALNKDDEAFDMVLDLAGNPYVAGYKTVNASNQTDYFTAKYSPSTGAVIWEVLTDGTNGLNDKATNIALDTLENVITTGESETSLGVYNYMTVKYAQADVTTPTDFNGEAVNKNQHYYRNNGQLINTSGAAVPDVKFYTQYTNPKFYFRDNNSSFVFAKVDTVGSTVDTLQRVDIKHTGSSELTKIYPLEEQKSFYLNYLLAHTPAEGINKVYGNQRLITPNLYPNIDLMYSSNQQGIKYYYIVKPGGDMRDIKLDFSGATSYSLNGTTNALSVNTKFGSLTFDRPTAYQLTTANATVAVTSFSPSFVVDGASNKYKFNDGAYTSSLTLVIQVDQGNTPISTASTLDNINWSTYIGSNAGDYYKDGAYSADDFYYATGYTHSADINATIGTTPVLTYSDIFVTKFDINGLRQWTTQFGGSTFDFGAGIAIDNNNQPIVVGYGNSTNMPRPNPFSSTAALIGSYDGIIMRLDGLGAVEWARFMGGTYYEEFNKVAVNSVNDIYVIGHTESTNFPYVASNGFNQNCSTGATGTKNGIAIKFSSYLPVASTCVGLAASHDWLTNLFVDKTNDNFYVVGYGNSITSVNPGNNAYVQAANAGAADGFIIKYNSSNTKLWATNFGGSGSEYINTINMNKQGHLYIAGKTNSTDIKHKYYNSGIGYNDTVKTVSGFVPFIARFDTKDSLIWNTYYKINDKLDNLIDLAIDTTSTIFITGTGSASGTCSFPNPSGGGAYHVTTNQGAQDAFIASFNKAGINAWGTYFSGDGSDIINAITFGKNATLYFCGSTQSSTGTYPLADNNGLGTLQPTFKGVADATAGLFMVTGNMVGIKEYAFTNNDMNVIVYPNPAQNELNVILKDNSLSLNYEIVNVQGQIVANGVLQNNKITLPNIAQGMYIITLKNKEGMFTQKFIKN